VVKRRDSGYTLMEIVVAMAVFGIFLVVLVTLTAEMRRYEKKLPVNFMKHPQMTAVLSRMRKDVLDADGENTYVSDWPPTNPEYTMGKQVLIINTWDPNGRKTVVWDLREAGIARRRIYNVGIVATDWVARGLPAQLEFDSVEFPGRPYGVRVTAKDINGRIAIDQIFQPRAHQ